MVIAGIDPGVNGGAIAVLEDDCDQAVLFDLPNFRVMTSTKKTRSELDFAAIWAFLHALAPLLDHVFIERVSALPSQGVTSMFRFGYACGGLHGVVCALGTPLSFVLPQVWQKSQGVGAGPDAARLRASQLYPAHAASFARKLDQHRADAVLIARHGRALLQPAATATSVPTPRAA